MVRASSQLLLDHLGRGGVAEDEPPEGRKYPVLGRTTAKKT